MILDIDDDDDDDEKMKKLVKFLCILHGPNQPTGPTLNCWTG